MKKLRKSLSIILILAAICSLFLIAPASAVSLPGEGDRIQLISALGYAVNDQYDKHDSSTQTCVLDKDDDQANEIMIVHTGYYGDELVFAFEFSQYSGRYLNVYGGAAAQRGDAVKVFSTGDLYNDLACWFYIESAGGGTVRIRSAVKPSCYLDTYGRTGGNPVRLYTLDSCSTDQLFTIVTVSGSAASREALEYYRQNTSPWDKKSYNPKGYTGRTMYDSGCGVFALANCIHAVTGADFSENAIMELADYAIRKGYRTSSGTSKELAVAFGKDHGSDYGFTTGTTYYYSSRTSANRQTIQSFKDVLDGGGALYFSVSSSSGGHIMACVEHRTNNGQDEYLLVDSYTSKNRLGSGTMKAWATLDDQLDFHVISNGNTITTKGSLGYYTILAR